jgi:hypothetical protein
MCSSEQSYECAARCFAHGRLIRHNLGCREEGRHMPEESGASPAAELKEYSPNFACYDFCAVGSLRGSLTGHLIGRLSCGKKLSASHLAGPFLESLGRI